MLNQKYQSTSLYQMKTKAVPALTLIKIPFAFFLMFNLLACAKQAIQPENILPACVFPNRQAAPGWICGESVAGLQVQATGVADKSVAGVNYMYDIARIVAVKHLTESFKAKAGKTVRQYLVALNAVNSVAIEAGASTMNAISRESLVVAKQYKSEIGPEGRAYVLVGLDPNTSRTLLENAVKSSMDHDPALWYKFSTLKPLDEIAADIAALSVR